jgi:hypothetical protein
MGNQLDAELHFSIVPEWVIDAGLSDKAIRLYVVLARYADNRTRQAFPSRETLASRMQCSTKSIDRATEELIQVGAVSKTQRYNSSLVYTLRVSRGVDTGVQGGSTWVSRGVDMGDDLTRTTELEPKELELLNQKQFDEFWKIYPKKDDKRPARKAFDKALTRATFEAIVEGATRYRDDPNREDRFTKNPATWLNADAWENGPLPSRRKMSAVENAMKMTMLFQQQQEQKQIEGENDGSR